jgi:hypothetical protein
MKKNLGLFGIFIALLVMTYIFQEKRVAKENYEAQLKDRLVDFEITHLKLPNVEAVKKDGSWWQDGRLLSHNSFKQIEKKLTEIKKIRDIQGDWKSFFPNPFSFEVNHIPWTIGDFSLDKQGFYVAVGKKIFLAVIEGESTHLTHDESEIESIKLNELVTELSKSGASLYETQLFRFYPDLPMEKVVMSAEGSLPFELDFEHNTSLPPPIPGVAVLKDLRGKFFQLLTQINIKEEILYSEKLKFKKLAVLKFIGKKKTVNWELWLRSKSTADAVIIDPESKKAFWMVGGTLKVFFIQNQDYWDKKVIPTEFFVSFTKIGARFIQGPQNAVVTIMNREPLVFESQGHKIDQLKMEQLIQFIFNLGPKDQAERVSILSKSEKQQLLSEEHLKIEVMDQELLLWRKLEELIVVNLTQGFKAHFILTDENFRGTFEDVLK